LDDKFSYLLSIHFLAIFRCSLCRPDITKCDSLHRCSALSREQAGHLNALDCSGDGSYCWRLYRYETPKESEIDSSL